MKYYTAFCYGALIGALCDYSTYHFSNIFIVPAALALPVIIFSLFGLVREGYLLARLHQDQTSSK